jgi:hypothetical protein
MPEIPSEYAPLPADDLSRALVPAQLDITEWIPKRISVTPIRRNPPCNSFSHLQEH